MIEANYHTIRARELGLPEGTGKRYNEADLIGFIKASPELPRNPFAEMLHEAVARYRGLIDEPDLSKRKVAAIEIFEELLIDYAVEVAPEDLPHGVTEETKSYMRLPTNRPVAGSQQEMEFLQSLLGGTPMSKEEGDNLLKKK